MNKQAALNYLFDYKGDKKQEIITLASQIVKTVFTGKVKKKIERQDVHHLNRQDVEKFCALLTEIGCEIDGGCKDIYIHVIHPLYWHYYKKGK